MAGGTGGCVRVAQGLGPRLPVAGGTGSFTPLLARHQPSGSPWPGAPGSLTPRGVDLPVAREYCCGACGPAAGHLRSLGTLVPPGRGSGAPGVYTPRSGSWLAGARQAAAPVSVPHMALSFSIMLERLEGSAAVMASWRERIKRRYTP